MKIEEPPKKKRASGGVSQRKRKPTSGGFLIAQSIDRLNRSRRTPETWVSEAISILFEQFSDRLSAEELSQAVEVLENSFKATVFCKMPKGDVRRLWLERQIESLL
jgi:hypothetical protein